jgi:hypothetical protein
MGSIESLLGNSVFSVCSMAIGMIADRYGPGFAIGVFQVSQFATLFLLWVYANAIKKMECAVVEA